MQCIQSWLGSAFAHPLQKQKPIWIHDSMSTWAAQCIWWRMTYCQLCCATVFCPICSILPLGMKMPDATLLITPKRTILTWSSDKVTLGNQWLQKRHETWVSKRMTRCMWANKSITDLEEAQKCSQTFRKNHKTNEKSNKLYISYISAY